MTTTGISVLITIPLSWNSLELQVATIKVSSRLRNQTEECIWHSCILHEFLYKSFAYQQTVKSVNQLYETYGTTTLYGYQENKKNVFYFEF